MPTTNVSVNVIFVQDDRTGNEVISLIVYREPSIICTSVQHLENFHPILRVMEEINEKLYNLVKEKDVTSVEAAEQLGYHV